MSSNDGFDPLYTLISVAVWAATQLIALVLVVWYIRRRRHRRQRALFQAQADQTQADPTQADPTQADQTQADRDIELQSVARPNEKQVRPLRGSSSNY